MNIEVQSRSTVVVRAEGEIDLSNAGELRTALDEAVDIAPGGFVLDLSDVHYIDSAGISAIISAYKRVHPQGGTVALVVTKQSVRELLKLIHPEMLPGLMLCGDMVSAETAVSMEGNDPDGFHYPVLEVSRLALCDRFRIFVLRVLAFQRFDSLFFFKVI